MREGEPKPGESIKNLEGLEAEVGNGEEEIAEKLKNAIEAKRAEAEQGPDNDRSEAVPESEEEVESVEPISDEQIQEMMLKMREKHGHILRIAEALGADTSENNFKAGMFTKVDKLDGYSGFRNNYRVLRHHLTKIRKQRNQIKHSDSTESTPSEEETPTEDFTYEDAKNLFDRVEMWGDKVIADAETQGLDVEKYKASNVLQGKNYEDTGEKEDNEVDESAPEPSPEPESGVEPEPEPTSELISLSKDYEPNEYVKNLHEARQTFVASRERYVNAWHAQDTDPSEDTKREYEEAKAAFTEARKARMAAIRAAAAGHAERRSEMAQLRGEYNIENDDAPKPLKGTGDVEELNNLDRKMAGAAVLESARMRLKLEQESLPKEKKGLLGAMQGILTGASERAKRAGEWMKENPGKTAVGLVVVGGIGTAAVVAARKGAIFGSSKVAGMIGGQEAAAAAAQTTATFLSAALLGAAAGRMSGALVGLTNQGVHNADRWWTKRKTRKQFNIDDIENDVRNMYRKEQSSAKAVQFTKKAKRAGTVAGAIAGLAVAPDTIGEDADVLFTPDDVDLGPGYAPDMADEYNEVINPSPEIADYTSESGDNFWDIMEGDTNAARPPIMDQMYEQDPKHVQPLIDLTRDYINNELSPAERAELGFGATADILPTGETVDMDRLNEIATMIAEREGWPETDALVIDANPAFEEVPAVPEAIDGVDLAELVYNVPEGAPGLSYTLEDAYPDPFASFTPDQWHEFIDKVNANPEVLEEAHVSSGNLNRIYPGEQIRLDVLAEFHIRDMIASAEARFVEGE